MRILFMGTPDFAVPSLKALLVSGHDLCGAFTQPDRPKNRGMKVQASPVKKFCLEHEIPVFQPDGLRNQETMDQIRSLGPDLIVVAAYGRILPDEILSVPAMGCINVHSSLLPRYRGAAPINWAIINGEDRTGVTIMDMVSELDAGDILAQRVVGIGTEETAPELTERLALVGAELLSETVEQIGAGTAARTPQQPELVTYAPMLTRELSPVDWTLSANRIHDRIRGLLPWPTVTAWIGDVRCKLLRARVCPDTCTLPTGSVVRADRGGLWIACGDGTALELLTVQPDGKKPMESAAFVAGHPLKEGSILS